MDQVVANNPLGLDEEELALLKSAGNTAAIADTPDPTEYHDPSQVRLELASGTMGSRMGGGPGGLGATMIPRATRDGGSQGFDPHHPSEVNIIDLSTKKQTTLDLSDVTKDEIAQLCDPNISADLGTVAAITFHRLAKKRAKQVQAYDESMTGAGTMSPPVVDQPEERVPPVGGYGTAYVVPKSTKGGSQVRTTIAKRRGFRKLGAPQVPAQRPPAQVTRNFPTNQQEEQRVRMLQNTPTQGPKRVSFSRSVQQTPAPAPEPVYEEEEILEGPQYEVHFEVPGVYEMTSNYHEVVLDDAFLVLVYDNRTPGNRFRPQPSKQPILVHVAGDDRIFRCYVPGIQYTTDRLDGDPGREHVVLLVDETVESYSEEPV